MMKHDEFFRKHPVFTGEELAKHLSSHAEVGVHAQEALLAYHQKTGRVVRVRRGLYAVIPVGAGAGKLPCETAAPMVTNARGLRMERCCGTTCGRTGG